MSYTRKEYYKVKRQICSILAGYAWDMDNPFVARSTEALKVLAEICKE